MNLNDKDHNPNIRQNRITNMQIFKFLNKIGDEESRNLFSCLKNVLSIGLTLEMYSRELKYAPELLKNELSLK